MCKVKAKIGEGESGTSRTHAEELGVRLGILAVVLMRQLKALQQRVSRISGGIAIVNLQNGFYGEPARFFAAFVSTHAVRDQCEPALARQLIVALALPVSERIFVVLALTADIAQASRLDSGPNPHCTSLQRNSCRLVTMSIEATDSSLRARDWRTRLSRTPRP